MKSLMVHLELGQSNSALLRRTGQLATRYEASVVGIALCQPMQILDGGGGGYYTGDIVEQDRIQIDKEMQEAEAEFRSALHTKSNAIHWRSTVTLEPLAEMLAHEARVADLVITGPGPGPDVGSTRRVAMGAFILQAGRPVLLVPSLADSTAAPSALDRVFIAWKDTRETRRAIADALPLLKHAAHVTVVEVAPEDGMASARSHLADVEAWLGRHGIAAEIVAAVSTGNEADQLSGMATEHRSDLLVAGAYGHNRVREWAFGGVTRDLLLHGTRCALLSH